MPLVKRYNDDGSASIETLGERYERVIDLIWGEKAEDEQNKNYRERLLGPDLIVAVPSRYSIVDFKKQYLGEWAAMSFEEKGELIAHSILNNQAELVKEHLRLQSQIRKENEAKVQRERKGK